MTECPQCGREIEGEGACAGCGRLQVEATCDRHPDRTAEGQCVVCGSVVCSECDKDEAREFLCPDHHAITVVDGWAQVYTTSDDLEAQLVRDNLRAEGTEAEILSQKDHFAVPVEYGDLSPVRVLVPAYAYADAMAVLARHMDDHGEVAFACPACGEAYESGTDRCAYCGAALPGTAEYEARADAGVEADDPDTIDTRVEPDLDAAIPDAHATRPFDDRAVDADPLDPAP